MPTWRYSDGRTFTGSAATDEKSAAIKPDAAVARCAALVRAGRHRGVLKQLEHLPAEDADDFAASPMQGPVWSDLTLTVLPDGKDEVRLGSLKLRRVGRQHLGGFGHEGK
eukprot:scaffold349_cov352-Prasinococcus_capsulatus_cf.AAC.4